MKYAFRISVLMCLAVGIATTCLAQTSAPASRAAHPDPTVPVPKANDARFMKLHESFLKRRAEGPIGLLFLGDSITMLWTKAPDVWNKYYGKFQPANFGIGGDHTEHVLWRIENGELDGISPKVVVLMIGTNNTATNTADEIADGDEKLVEEIRAKLADTKSVLLGIFPHGPDTSTHMN